jgi:two-component system LytT family response regulator
MTRTRWRVVIADDEPAARLGVRQLLAGFRDFAIAGECRNGDEVLAALDDIDPHVLFLDIQMPGIDGFEVLRRRTPERLPAVVFLTAYDEFAVRAFEAQALDYLVKPVSEARFAATMTRLVKHLNARSPDLQEQQLVVTTSRGLAVVPIGDVEWIEAEDNYARVWTRDGRSQLLRQSLNELEPRVRASGFIRVHRQALVAVASVRELQRTSSGLVAVLAGGTRVTVSRRRRAHVAAAVRKHSRLSTSARS